MYSKGINDLNKVNIQSSSGNVATIYQHGAHLTSWKSSDGTDLIFTSNNAIFNPPTPIRGGIPICFPSFSDMTPTAKAHGFARNHPWTLSSSSSSSSQHTAIFTFNSSQQLSQSEGYSNPFILTLTTSIHDDDKLEQTLSITNTSTTDSMPFTCALHTYFRVSDSQQALVKGLHNCSYLDNLQNRMKIQPQKEDDNNNGNDNDNAVTFPGEVDRIYLSAPDMIKLEDPAAKRAFIIRKDNFPDAVVWNPHVKKAQEMKDFGDEEWREMVCVEVAQAGSGEVVLGPGESWTGRQTIEYAILDSL
jgi:glucose-6-phosphate 1-epimerase